MWLTLVWTEGLLLWRSRMVSLYLIAILVLLASVLLLNPEALAEIVPRVATGILVIQLPILALGLAPAITRTAGPPGDILWVAAPPLPYVAAARLAAAGVAVSLVLVLTAIVTGGFLGWRSGNLLVHGGFLGYTLLRLLLPITWAQILWVHALTYLWPRTLWPTLACTALACAMALGSQFTVWSMVHPLNFGLITLSFSAVLGLGADSLLQGRLAGMYMALSLWLWLGSLHWAARRTPHIGWPPRHDPWLLGWAIGSLGLGLTVGVMYFRGVQERIVPATATQQVEVWHVLSAHHKVWIDQGELQAESRIRLRNISPTVQETVDLALNPGLHVLETAWNHQTGHMRRQGEVVVIHHPGMRIPPASDVEVHLRYQGSPVLMREDYGAVVSLPFLPPSFRRATVSYMDRQSLFWVRDSDWLAWPLRPGPHRPAATQTIQIAVAPDAHPALVSTARHIEPRIGDADFRWHHWAHPVPALLLAAGPFAPLARDQGILHMGRFHAADAGERAGQILSWVQQLEAQWDQSVAHSEVYALPYGTRILFSAPYLLIPEQRLRLPYGPGVASVQEAQLLSAIHLAADWLQEEIPWEQGPMTLDGKIRGYDSDCTLREDGQLDCQVVLPRARNLQAPHKRWLPQPGPPVWHQAFAVVIAHRTLFGAFPELIADEKQAWRQLTESANAGFHLHPVGVGRPLEVDPCALAAAVASLHRLADSRGDRFLWQWLAALQASRAQDGEPLDEPTVWRLGEATAGSPLLPVMAPCLATTPSAN